MTEGDKISTISFEQIGDPDEFDTAELFDVIDFNHYLENIEREIFRKAWKKYGSSTKVAQALSISQPTAYRKLQKYIKSYSK